MHSARSRSFLPPLATWDAVSTRRGGEEAGEVVVFLLLLLLLFLLLLFIDAVVVLLAGDGRSRVEWPACPSSSTVTSVDHVAVIARQNASHLRHWNRRRPGRPLRNQFAISQICSARCVLTLFCLSTGRRRTTAHRSRQRGRRIKPYWPQAGDRRKSQFVSSFATLCHISHPSEPKSARCHSRPVPPFVGPRLGRSLHISVEKTIHCLPPTQLNGHSTWARREPARQGGSPARCSSARALG